MRVFSAIFAAVILFSFNSYSYAANSAAEAEKLIDSGEYAKAEAMLDRLIAAEPKKPVYHQLLADAYKKEGKLDEAISEYEKAISLGGNNAEVQKSMGTVYKWKGEGRTAAGHYEEALKLNPGDREARSDLDSLKRGRGLTVSLMAGGWEADNTTEKYEGTLGYNGIDRHYMNVGGSYSKSAYYDRYKYYLNDYYYYKPGSYFKTSLSYKDYNYPAGTGLQPDANSYDKVPSVEFEVSHWLTEKVRGTVAYEFFRPSFQNDSGSHANNHKIAAEAYWLTPIDWLRLKVMYAILRDPDPGTTEIKGTDNFKTATVGDTFAATNVEYQTQSLLGGGVEVVKEKWNAELKYIPNRDLDRSYSWSVVAGAQYDFTEKFRGRVDYVHDKYSTDSSQAGKTADVYLFSVFYRLNESTDLGTGFKVINLPTTDDTAGFVTVSYKTGLGF